MKIHNDWTTGAFGLPLVAEAVGPFAGAHFLSRVTALDGSTPLLVEGDDALWPLATWDDSEVVMAGRGDLTDYHSPRGTDAAGTLAEFVGTLGTGVRIGFDSLPLPAAETAAKGLEMAGVSTSMILDDVAAVLDLPDSVDDYMEDIGKKQRHEIRRKRRRYREGIGELIRERHSEPGWGFDEFIRLHRMAEGEKGEFMTADRLAFFEGLMDSDGWVVDLLRHPVEDRATACAFSHVDVDYSLYNSSYDPTLAESSPGVALLGVLIEGAIEDRCQRFDFLKGDEVYKFRLGAFERPLFTVTGTT